MTSITFFFILVPVLAATLLAVNLILAPHSPYQEKDSAFECGFHSFLGQNRTQFNISFYIFGLLFLLFDLEIFLVFPYITSAYNNDGYGLTVMMIFFLVLTAGFAFELGKNALKIESRQHSTKNTSNTLDGSSNLPLQSKISLSIFKYLNTKTLILILIRFVCSQMLMVLWFFITHDTPWSILDLNLLNYLLYTSISTSIIHIISLLCMNNIWNTKNYLKNLFAVVITGFFMKWGILNIKEYLALMECLDLDTFVSVLALLINLCWVNIFDMHAVSNVPLNSGPFAGPERVPVIAMNRPVPVEPPLSVGPPSHRLPPTNPVGTGRAHVAEPVGGSQETRRPVLPTTSLAGLNAGTDVRTALPFRTYRDGAHVGVYDMDRGSVTIGTDPLGTVPIDVNFEDPCRQLEKGFNPNGSNQPLARNIGRTLYELRKAGVDTLPYTMLGTKQEAKFLFLQRAGLGDMTPSVRVRIKVTDELLTNLFNQK